MTRKFLGRYGSLLFVTVLSSPMVSRVSADPVDAITDEAAGSVIVAQAADSSGSPAETEKTAQKKRPWWKIGGSHGEAPASDADSSSYVPQTNAEQQRWAPPRELKALRTTSSATTTPGPRTESSDKMKWLKNRYPELSDKERDSESRLQKLMDRAHGIQDRQKERETQYIEDERKFQEETRRIQEGLAREHAGEDPGDADSAPPADELHPKAKKSKKSKDKEIGESTKSGKSTKASSRKMSKAEARKNQKLKRLQEKKANLLEVGASAEEISKVDAEIAKLKGSDQRAEGGGKEPAAGEGGSRKEPRAAAPADAGDGPDPQKEP